MILRFSIKDDNTLHFFLECPIRVDFEKLIFININSLLYLNFYTLVNFSSHLFSVTLLIEIIEKGASQRKKNRGGGNGEQ